MNLGQLKKALKRFPPDMDDLEIAVQIVREGKDQYELLCYVGYAENIQTFMLGGETAVKKLIAEGKLQNTGYTPTSENGYVEPTQ